MKPRAVTFSKGIFERCEKCGRVLPAGVYTKEVQGVGVKLLHVAFRCPDCKKSYWVTYLRHQVWEPPDMIAKLPKNVELERLAEAEEAEEERKAQRVAVGVA